MAAERIALRGFERVIEETLPLVGGPARGRPFGQVRIQQDLIVGLPGALVDQAMREGAFGASAPEGCFVSCGTLGAKPNARGDGIRPAAQMELEIHDPRLGRTIVHRYAAQVLPVIA